VPPFCLFMYVASRGGQQFFTCCPAGYIAFIWSHVTTNQPITFGVHASYFTISIIQWSSIYDWPLWYSMNACSSNSLCKPLLNWQICDRYMSKFCRISAKYMYESICHISATYRNLAPWHICHSYVMADICHSKVICDRHLSQLCDRHLSHICNI
jgi:hypothetical protein